VNRLSAEPEIPSSWRVEKRIWWFAVSQAAEREEGGDISVKYLCDDKESSLSLLEVGLVRVNVLVESCRVGERLHAQV
jgi:hypothetical protein